MNNTIRTSCISYLASEISRLKVHRDDLNIRVGALISERSEVNNDLVLLKMALEKILETREEN